MSPHANRRAAGPSRSGAKTAIAGFAAVTLAHALLPAAAARVQLSVSDVAFSPAATEDLRWGPQALAIAPDGGYWIANTVSSELLHVGPDGGLLARIDVAELTTGVTDLETTAAGIFALDGAAVEPAVLHFS